MLGVVVMCAGGETDVPMMADPESKRVRPGFWLCMFALAVRWFEGESKG